MNAIMASVTDHLGHMRTQMDAALEALEDEREGDFTTAILRLQQHADACAELVRAW